MDRIVGARLHAALAADANRVVEFDDAVVALVHRSGRTDAHAGWVCAVVAARHLEMASAVRETPGFNRFHPSAVNTEWNIILAFAGSGAGMAADAGSVVDDESKIHSDLISMASKQGLGRAVVLRFDPHVSKRVQRSDRRTLFSVTRSYTMRPSHLFDEVEFEEAP